MICDAVMFLNQQVLWRGGAIEHFLFVTEHVNISLEWHSKHANTISQFNFQIDYDVERREFGSENQRIDRVLFLTQPHNWCLVAEYQYSCL